MDTSVFTQRAKTPTEKDLAGALGESYRFWVEIRDFVMARNPALATEWNYPGVKYGWSFRIRDKRRAIIYLLPRDNFFRVAFVFGQRACDEIMQSDLSEGIKKELSEARLYAEGRGIRMVVKEAATVAEILKLAEIKIRC
jgi:hypothetical protein